MKILSISSFAVQRTSSNRISRYHACVHSRGLIRARRRRVARVRRRDVVPPDKWGRWRAIDCARRTDRLALMRFVDPPPLPDSVTRPRNNGRDVGREIGRCLERHLRTPPREFFLASDPWRAHGCFQSREKPERSSRVSAPPSGRVGYRIDEIRSGLFRCF